MKLPRLMMVALIASIGIAQLGVADTVTKDLTRAGSIHDLATGNNSPTTDYYGSGNDDDFGEFGVATFQFSASDFSELVTDLGAVDFTLTHNDRNFSDGTEFELFLTTDDFDLTFTGLVYDDSGANDSNGLDLSQFTNISSLGTFAYAPLAGGTQETFSLNLSASQEADLINEINTGSEFGIVIAATDSTADITFTGDDDSFEAGGQPTLSITSPPAVPEPSAAAVLALGGLIFVRRKRS